MEFGNRYMKGYKNKVDFVPGLDGLGEKDGNDPLLVVVDDLMDEMDKRVLDMFTKKSHHQNTSIILIVQNLFVNNKFFRTVSLNAHYLVVFENPRDKSTDSILGTSDRTSQEWRCVRGVRSGNRGSSSTVLQACRSI